MILNFKKRFGNLATLDPVTLYVLPSSALSLVIMMIRTATFISSVPY